MFFNAKFSNRSKPNFRDELRLIFGKIGKLYLENNWIVKKLREIVENVKESRNLRNVCNTANSIDPLSANIICDLQPFFQCLLIKKHFKIGNKHRVYYSEKGQR